MKYYLKLQKYHYQVSNTPIHVLFIERNRNQDNELILESTNNCELEEEREDQVGQLMGSSINHGINNQGSSTQLLRAQANTPMEFPKGFSAKSRPSI